MAESNQDPFGAGQAIAAPKDGQLPKARPLVTVVKVVAAAVAVLLVSAVCVAAIAVWGLASSIKPGVDLGGEPPPDPMIGALPGEINLLVVGSDSAQGDPLYGERGEHLNDVTMLLNVSKDHSRATVVSFPRDMFVPIPACRRPEGGTFPAMSSQKLNTTLSYGGLACTVLTVEELTGLPIDYAAEIEFQGLIAMSVAVGGVPVCVAAKIEDTRSPFPFVLEPGEHVLEGEQALAFLRTRYGLHTGSDLARSSNQRVFLSSLFRKVTSEETLSNPVRLYGLAQAALDNMTFSSSLGNIPTMVSIALALKDIDADQMLFVQYPTDEVEGGLDPRLADADELFQALQGDGPLELSGDTGPGSKLAGDATAPPQSSDASGPPGSKASPSPSSGTSIKLPQSVQGQTAAQETCSIGRPLSEQ